MFRSDRGSEDVDVAMTPEQMTPEQLKKFLVYYRKRIERNPENVEARLRLATVFREMGQRPRAIEQYEAAAQLLDDQGLALEAIAACKAILELDPSRVEAQYFLARLYAQTPDATDTSARVAQPVEPADEEDPHELVHEADEADQSDQTRDSDLVDTQEWEAEEADIERPDEEPTRVADYADFEDEWDDTVVSEQDGGSHIELTPEEQERREGFSREEMEDLLTTIDVDPEDIVDIENLDDYEFEDELVDDMDDDVAAEVDEVEEGEPAEESDEADFELSEKLEVDE
jgi:tetratricopeptide (TPR) repeat protein